MKTTDEIVEEFMQHFFVTYEGQKYQAYPCHITEFQEECIEEKLKEVLKEKDKECEERVRIALDKIEMLLDKTCVMGESVCPKCASLELVRRSLTPTKTDKQ